MIGSRLFSCWVVVCGVTMVVGAPAACDNTPVCVPAATVTGCPCNTGGPGYQVCKADGLGYGGCLCGVPPDAGDAAPNTETDGEATDAAGEAAFEAEAGPDSSATAPDVLVEH